MRPGRKRKTGFTLIELLVVVAILGLLASILVPLMLDALQKAKQKRSMADIRGIGVGWMSWLADQQGAASAGAVKYYNGSGLTDVTFAELEGYLRPSDSFFYVQDLPQFDAWDHEIRFRRGIEKVLVCSSGRDGNFTLCGENQIPSRPFIATDYDQDLVWADGYFVRWPSSTLRN